MINYINNSIIAIIPARGGSKGIPGKNKKDFLGKPLVSHSIDYAMSGLKKESIYLSTDDDDIKEIGLNKGIKIVDRPSNLASDEATTESAIDHVLDNCVILPEIIILLQPTSPLRPENSFNKLIEYFVSAQFDSLLTISPTHRFFWQIKGINATPLYDFNNRPRRQDMKEEDIKYIENGSVYAFTFNHFKKTGNRLGGKIGYYIFPEEYSIELDSISDWTYLESIGKSIKDQL